MSVFDHHHDFVSDDSALRHNERKTFYVSVITAITMVVEIVAGYWTESMALLADGWHMASHTAALGIALIAYRFARSPRIRARLTFGGGKLIPLGGYTSALILGVIAILMLVESVAHLVRPHAIQFDEAFLVAWIGLAVNLGSVFILGHEHSEHSHDDSHAHAHAHAHDHDHDDSHDHEHDHTFASTYWHVVTDLLTSVLAVIALAAGKYWNIFWLDPAMGILGSVLILRWAVQLCRDTAWELVDGHSKQINIHAIKNLIEEQGAIVKDLHVWRIAPKAHACEIVLSCSKQHGVEFYKELVLKHPLIRHVVIEVSEG